MATTFKAQLLDNEYLPHNLRDEFYQTMKQTVVVVRVCYDGETPPTYWGGVCMGPDGLVVTAAHILPSNSKLVAFRCHGESNFVPANVLHTDARSDLLLLRRKKIGDDCSREIPYVECCPDTDIHVGMEAIAIGHPCNMVYTIAVGHVAFPVCGIDDPYENVPCADKTPNTRRMVDCKIGDCEDLEDHRDDLQLIQLNNIHGSSASAGSAIFTSAGLLLGVEIFVHNKFDFCVHNSTIKHFTEHGLTVKKKKRKPSQSSLEMRKIKYLKTEQKGRGKEGRKRNVVSLTKLRTDREHVKPQNSRPFEDIHEWEMDPESSKHRRATSTERRELEGILSTVDKKVVLGSGYEGDFCEEESGCSKYMVDVQLPVMSESPKLNLNPSNGSARELDDLSTYLKLNSGSVEKALVCARELDDICNMLRKKNEEAKELLACSIANSNALMLLNHPMLDRIKSRKS